MKCVVYCVFIYYSASVTEMLGNVLSLKDEDDLAVDEDDQVANQCFKQ